MLIVLGEAHSHTRTQHLNTPQVMFSSSLLFGNFLTIEQRRLIAMRVVEESHRVQVTIHSLQWCMDLYLQLCMGLICSCRRRLSTSLNGAL